MDNAPQRPPKTNSGRLNPKLGYYGLIRPCKMCPFRHDVTPYIRAGFVRELEAALKRTTFTCHETTVPGEEDAEGFDTMVDGPNAKHCAGALILMEKEGRSNQMMRIAERLGIYDATRLDMKSPVYRSWEEMVEAHEGEK